MKSLLNDETTTADVLNKELIKAVQSGNADDVRLLLADKRVDPCFQDNKPIKYAQRHNLYDVYVVLFKDGRADIFNGDDSMYDPGIRHCYKKVMDTMIDRNELIPETPFKIPRRAFSLFNFLPKTLTYKREYEKSERIAVRKGIEEMLEKRVMDNEQILREYVDNRILLHAVKYNYHDIVNTLLKSGRFSTYANESEAYKMAKGDNKKECVAAFLQNGHIDEDDPCG